MFGSLDLNQPYRIRSGKSVRYGLFPLLDSCSVAAMMGAQLAKGKNSRNRTSAGDGSFLFSAFSLVTGKRLGFSRHADKDRPNIDLIITVHHSRNETFLTVTDGAEPDRACASRMSSLLTVNDKEIFVILPRSVESVQQGFIFRSEGVRNVIIDGNNFILLNLNIKSINFD